MKKPRLYGVYPYSDRRPTFALPIFRFGDEWLIQRPAFQNETRFVFDSIDQSEVQYKIIVTKANIDSKERMIAYVGVGDSVEIGTKEQMRSRLTSLAKGVSGNSIALQAAEILGLEEDRRAALANVTKSIKNKTGSRAASSFAKSAALSVAWDHIQNANLNEDEKKSVLAQLHMIKIDMSGLNPEIDLSEIEENVRKLIDIQALTREIKREILDPILESADNDRGSWYDIPGEIPKARARFDQRLGPDKRMSATSYFRIIRLAGMLGIHGVDEIFEIIQDYDDTQVSDLATGARQGQASRVELMIMAALGDEYIRRFPYYGNDYLKRYHTSMIEKLRAAGIPVGKKRARHPTNIKFGTVREPRPSSKAAPSLFDALES